jgi:ankyrin repeat protein
MGVKIRSLGGRWIVFLLSVASFAATSSSDLRLVEAEKNRDGEAVRSLLRQHVDVNTPQADGATALAWAAHWDDLETADLLIHAGANANAANDYGVTALSLACSNANAAMVEKLLKAGANPNATLSTGETALMIAAHTGNVDAVKSLLAHGADVNAKETRRGQTALMWAEKHADVVRLLIEHGADIHVRSTGGFTPLLFAAQQGNLDSARILLAAGANVNEATPEDGSALVVASASGHEALS